MGDILHLTGKSFIFTPLNSDLSEYLTGVYSRGSLEETKSWLRKLIRREVLSKTDASQYQKVIEKLGLKLNAFINSTKG